MTIGQHYDEICKMREEGFTLREIGEKYGVTRQRVDQIFKKFGRVSRGLITTEELAKISKMSSTQVRELIEYELIVPKRQVKLEGVVWRYWENKPLNPELLISLQAKKANN